jgi:hypothetical protein
MKSPAEIMKGLSLCPGDSVDCEQELCPYWDVRLCVPELHADVMDMIKRFEAHCTSLEFDLAVARMREAEEYEGRT